MLLLKRRAKKIGQDAFWLTDPYLNGRLSIYEKGRVDATCVALNCDFPNPPIMIARIASGVAHPAAECEAGIEQADIREAGFTQDRFVLLWREDG